MELIHDPQGARTEPLVAPFAAERYADGSHLSELIAPPYDVVSTELRETLARRHPRNIVHLTLPAGDGGDRYRRAAALLKEWRAGGVFARDGRPGLYAVRQEFTVGGEPRARTGVIGAVAVEPFAGGRVKPHERTHAGPKEDRLALLRATRSTFEALYLLARDEDASLLAALRQVTQKTPAARVELQGVIVSLWPVAGRRAKEIAKLAGAGSLYIADGHHRYETHVAYRSENAAATRVPALIVPLGDPGLVVLATHRLVRGKAIDPEHLVEHLRDRFQVRELPPNANYVEELARMRSRGTAAVVVLPAGKALAFLLKGGASLGDLPFAHQPAVASLDVARVDEIIVKRLRSQAGDEAAPASSPDAGEVIDAVRQGGAAAGVLLNPTPVEQVLAVADAGGVLPPKATYFVPKVPSGLVGISYP